MDPDIILGGFPAGPEFRNYSADATAFVVTYPVDSSKDNRCCSRHSPVDGVKAHM